MSGIFSNFTSSLIAAGKTLKTTYVNNLPPPDANAHTDQAHLGTYDGSSSLLGFDLNALKKSVAGGLNGLANTLNSAATPPQTQPGATETALAGLDLRDLGNKASGLLSQFTTGTAPQAPPSAQQTEGTLKNGVTITHENGGFKAELPGGLGGGHLLPAPMEVEAHLNPQGQPEYIATFTDKNHKPLAGAPEMHGQKQLDGNVYFSADEKNPNAPLMVFSDDGAYGLSSPMHFQDPSAPADSRLYSRDRIETVEGDGTRVMKFNETTSGPQAAPSQGSTLLTGVIGLGLGMGMGMASGPPAGIGHDYSEIRIDSQNHMQADNVDEHLMPFQKSQPQSTVSAYMAGGMGGGGVSRNETPRLAHLDSTGHDVVTEQASITTKLGHSLLGHGAATHMSFSDTKAETFHPFSTNELATAEGAMALFGPAISEEIKQS
jgi:hypothetical protein